MAGFGGKVAVVGGGGKGRSAARWEGLSDAAPGGESGVRSTSVLALGPLCRRSAPGVDRLQLHDRGHLPDRQSRAASHSRPHAGRRREGRARAQNGKDNEQLHEYLERIYRRVKAQHTTTPRQGCEIAQFFALEEEAQANDAHDAQTR